MKNVWPLDYTHDALCLDNAGGIETLAYLVALVDSQTHPAANPDIARYKVLYPLAEAEGHAKKARHLLSMQAEFLPNAYTPLTPVMFVKRWSPVYSMLERGFEPISLSRGTVGPSAVATGIWPPPSAPLQAKG